LPCYSKETAHILAAFKIFQDPLIKRQEVRPNDLKAVAFQNGALCFFEGDGKSNLQQSFFSDRVKKVGELENNHHSLS
jgi:hypothetical protein